MSGRPADDGADLPRRTFLQVAVQGGVGLALGACAAEPSVADTAKESTADDGGSADTGSPGGGAGVPDLDAEIPPTTPNDDFYVQSVLGTPDVDTQAWRLQIGGAVSGRATISLAELQALGGRDKEHTLMCIGSSPTWKAVDNAVWTGVPLGEVLDAYGLEADAGAIELQFESADGYRTALPLSDLQDREIWLVWGMNGAPLPPDHGAPLRVLVPDRYGMKNPKWVTQISFGTEALLGTWESGGWSNDATIQPVAYAHLPDPDGRLPLDTVPISGSAFCGTGRPERVEVSEDDGVTWTEAAFVYEGPDDAWNLWRFEWVPPRAGTFTLLVRVFAEDGRSSDADWDNGLAGYGGYDIVELMVAEG
jgi:DMSO/TMAO reductase YedYZ molybdopterin-dependent catalytic subunit